MWRSASGAATLAALLVTQPTMASPAITGTAAGPSPVVGGKSPVVGRKSTTVVRNSAVDGGSTVAAGLSTPIAGPATRVVGLAIPWPYKPVQDRTVKFAFDCATLTPAMTRQIHQLAYRIEPGTHFWVTGHTDATGPADYNQDLSYRRALEVARELQRLGASTTVRYNGESKPLGGPLADDRRVEITLASRGGRAAPPPQRWDRDDSHCTN